HAEEARVGVQVTGPVPEEVAEAVAVLDEMGFDAIDINMGCPVNKVVCAGSGSALLKDPTKVFDTVRRARSATDKLFSVKIRLGWDHTTINAVEVAKAIAEGGAD